MLLAIDIGNSNITLGGIQEGEILFEARLATDATKTSDEYGVEIKDMLDLFGARVEEIRDCIVASVVPPVFNSVRNGIVKLTGKEPMVVGPGIKTGINILLEDPGATGADLIAAAVAAVIAGNTDPSVPINGAELTLFGAAGKRLSDNEIDQLVRGGVTPIETVGGVSSPVRGITTKTSSGGAADTTWRELTTILIVDEVIPTIRSALRTRFARSKNTAQSRGAIRSQVVLELEEMKSREIVDSYGEVLVSALKSDPTVCLVEFSFTVVHGLNRIYLTAHITV